VQIALGCLSREAREKDHNWGTLGWIPNIPKDKSQGRRSFVESGHADLTRLRAELTHDEGLIGVAGSAHPAQDPHVMISFVLKGLVQLQKTGFSWDLMYNGRLHKGVKMIPFVHFCAWTPKKRTYFAANASTKTNTLPIFAVNVTARLTKATTIWPITRPKRRVKLLLWCYERMKYDSRICLNSAF